jgi:hypothetical protein
VGGPVARHFANRRRISTWAAWAGAYAFVLHAMLASIVPAGLSPLDLAAGSEICASGAQHSAPDDGGKTTKHALVHCILCAGVHAGGAMPPEGTVFALRLAILLGQDLPFDERLSELTNASPHQARGPPTFS